MQILAKGSRSEAGRSKLFRLRIGKRVTRWR